MRKRRRAVGRERERPGKKKKTFILIVCENGVLVFKQCYLSKNHVQVMCY